MSFVLGVTKDDHEAVLVDTLLSIFRQTYEDIEIIVIDCDLRLPTSPGLSRIISLDDRVVVVSPPDGMDTISLGLGLGCGIRMSRCQYIVLCAGGFVYSANAVGLLLEGARRIDFDPRFIIVPQDLGAGVPPKSPYFEEMVRFSDDVRLSSIMLPRDVLGLCLPDPYLKKGIARDLVNRLSAVSGFVTLEHPVGHELQGLAEDAVRGEPLSCHRLRVETFRRYRPELNVKVVGGLDVVPKPLDLKRPFLLIIGRIDSSVSLVFDPLAEISDLEVLFVEPEYCSRHDLIGLLCRASRVIVVRYIHPTSPNADTIDLARMLGVQLAYYIDDNFTALQAERQDFAWYTIENIRNSLSDFAVVYVTSPALEGFYRNNNVHRSIELLSPAVEMALELATRSADRGHEPVSPEWQVAFFGGAFRYALFNKLILPALEIMANERSVSLIVPENVSINTKLPVLKAQGHRSFGQFILNWCRLAPKVVVHPPGQSANIDFKTANAILCSYYLGAVPIVFDEPAYADWDEDDGVVKVRQPTIETVEEALASMLDEGRRNMAFERLKSAVGRRFDGSKNLKSILQNLDHPSAVATELRYLRALQFPASRTAIGS